MSDGIFGHIYFNEATGKSTVLLETLPGFTTVTGQNASEALSYEYDLELSDFALDKPSDLFIAVRRIGE